jgi:maleylacetate reductase
MLNFIYEQLPVRVVFAAGSFDRLAEEVERLGLKRAMVLSTPGQRRLAEEAAKRLGVATAGIHAEAVMHVPVDTARLARETARRLAADCLVAIGGGSTIGLAKAVALDTGLPIIAVPTTYSGSEMTPIYGLTDGGVKRTGRDRKVLPRVVLYDAALTVGLPAKVSGSSGMNALAHCVEAPQGLYDLAKKLGAPLSLKELGMPEDGIERAAKLATESPYQNPRPVEYAGVKRLIEDAWHGRRPA